MKKLRYYILIIIFFIFGCRQNNNNSNNKIDSLNTSNFDTIVEKDTISENIESQNYVTLNFVKLVNYIDSCGYICDSNRLKKVGYIELENKNIQIINNKFFYLIDIEKHQIFRGKRIFDYHHNRLIEKMKNDSTKKYNYDISKYNFNYDIFRKAITVYGYFYTENKQRGWIHDGMIEEWKFETSEDAIKAITEVRKMGSDLYFNTKPFYLQIDNYFYIFHTRAAAFNETLRKFYEEFRKQTKK